MQTSIVATQFSTNKDTLITCQAEVAFFANPLLTGKKEHSQKTLYENRELS
jgi:hypothetical protein